MNELINVVIECIIVFERGRGIVIDAAVNLPKSLAVNRSIDRRLNPAR